MATPLRKRIKLALDEARMVVLGLQVLLGFGGRATFEEGFARLLYRGQPAPPLHRLVLAAVGAALLPFALALGASVFAGSNCGRWARGRRGRAGPPAARRATPPAGLRWGRSAGPARR